MSEGSALNSQNADLTTKVIQVVLKIVLYVTSKLSPHSHEIKTLNLHLHPRNV